MPPKLLKFDIIHPSTYLEKKKKEWDDLDKLSAAEYRKRLISLRSNYSDFYTHHLNELGWEAEEFFLIDKLYLDKIGKELFGARWLYEKYYSKCWGKIRPTRWGWKQRVVQAYIHKFQPDVIFARSQPMASKYWQQFRDDCLLVARLSAKLPHHWHPQDWDLIYTDIESFKDFFEAHNVSTKLNKQGFDIRINDEIEKRPPKHEVVFIGGMGTENFSRRTQLFEKIAASDIDFKWWGYWWKFGGWGNLNDFPNLKESFKGPTSGLEMYQIYSDSKIVLNDYVDIDINDNIGYNQRMFEVMGVGAFMLTREAENFDSDFPSDIFATFSSASDCITKINKYLTNVAERKEIAQKAQQFVLNEYNYKDIIEHFDAELRHHLEKKQAVQLK